MLLPRRNLLLGAAALPFAGLAVGALPRPVWSQEAAKTLHGIAMHGEPKYGPDFAHFDYVDPTALKGGELGSQPSARSTTSNPFILRGTAAAGASLPFETLTEGSDDEAFSEYGRLAETIEVPDDRSWVAFNLRPQARWHDGRPITVEDVIFSLQTLKKRAVPLSGLLREPREGREDRRAESEIYLRRRRQPRTAPDHGTTPSTAEALLGGAGFESRASIRRSAAVLTRSKRSKRAARSRCKRVKTIGAKICRSRSAKTIGTSRYKYYRDQRVAIEAFKAGEYDLHQENSGEAVGDHL